MFSMERTRKLMIVLYIVAGLAAVVALIALSAGFRRDPSTVFQDAVLVFFLSLGAALTLGLIRKDVQEELRFLETELNRDAKKKGSERM